MKGAMDGKVEEKQIQRRRGGKAVPGQRSAVADEIEGAERLIGRWFEGC